MRPVISKLPSRRSLSFTLPSRLRQLQVGLQVERAFHERSVFHGQTQDVGHAPARHVDVELDGAVLVAFVLEDDAAGGEVRGAQSGLTGLSVVLPLVPSTSTSNFVRSGTGLPERLRRKSGT